MRALLPPPAANLPEPVDDGAASHLPGLPLPDVSLASTAGSPVRLARLHGRAVIYVYPRTGRPGVVPPEGWDRIPGARGCTPQSCSFRDRYAELCALGAVVFGVSAQSSEEQREARDRLRLPFQLLSDTSLGLKQTLALPTFTVAGQELYKRLTLIAEGGFIRSVFYPVFPPDRNVDDVLACLRQGTAPHA